MFGAVVSTLMICAFAMAGCLILKKRIELLFPIVSSIIVVLIYLSGIFKVLRAGSVIVMLLSIAALVYLIIMAIKRIKIFKEYALTPGLLYVIISSVVFVFAYFGIEAASWDEFSHWVDYVKVMTLFGKYGSVETQSNFASYIPGLPSYEYFFQSVNNLFAELKFSEWLVYYAYHILVTTLTIPFMYKAEWKKPHTYIVPMLVIFSIPSFASSTFYDFVLVDPIISIISGCGIAFLLFYEEKDYFEDVIIIAYAFLLTMTKSTGLLFGVILLFALMMRSVITKNKKWIFELICGGGIVGVTKLSWTLFVNLNNINKVFSAKIDLKSFVRVIFKKENSYRTTVLDTFLANFRYAAVNFRNGRIQISYPLFLIIVITIFALIGFINARNKEDKKQVFLFSLVLVFQTGVYVIGTLMAYMYKFSEGEALAVASFSRYMTVGLSIPFIVLLLYVMDLLMKKSSFYGVILFSLMVVGLLPSKLLINLCTRHYVHNNYTFRAELDEMADKVNEISEDGDVMIVSQGDNGYDYYVLKFLLRPSKVYQGWSFCADNPSEYDKIYSKDELLNEILNNYEYVVVFRTNETFISSYSELFENGDVEERTVYSYDNNTHLLTKVD